MSVVEGPKSAGLIARVQAILLKPAAEWDVIAAEPASAQSLFVGYACILAAIGPVASLIGSQLFGVPTLFGVVHTPLIAAVVGAVVSYGLSLLSVFVLGLIIEALAPSFEGTKDRVQGLKVAVYASTPGWVAGIVLLVPALRIIAVLCGLYGLYLTYLGLPRLMKSPQDKALVYTVVTVVAAIVLYIVVGLIVASVAGAALFGGMAAAGAGA